MVEEGAPGIRRVGGNHLRGSAAHRDVRVVAWVGNDGAHRAGVYLHNHAGAGNKSRAVRRLYYRAREKALKIGVKRESNRFPHLCRDNDAFGTNAPEGVDFSKELAVLPGELFVIHFLKAGKSLLLGVIVDALRVLLRVRNVADNR